LLESAITSTIKKRDQRVTISNTIKRDCLERGGATINI